MGKGARFREKRAREATPPPAPPDELIVVENPTEPTATTRDPDDASCMVKGCPAFALERHEGPNGTVWLCGSCGSIARRNLADEAARQAFTDAIAELHRPMLEVYMAQQRRLYGRGAERDRDHSPLRSRLLPGNARR